MVYKEEVEGFIKTINRGPLKEYFLQKTPEVIKIDWNENDIYETALYQGYLDACRTFVQPKGAKKSLPNETKKENT